MRMMSVVEPLDTRLTWDIPKGKAGSRIASWTAGRALLVERVRELRGSMSCCR